MIIMFLIIQFSFMWIINSISPESIKRPLFISLPYFLLLRARLENQNFNQKKYQIYVTFIY